MNQGLKVMTTAARNGTEMEQGKNYRGAIYFKKWLAIAPFFCWGGRMLTFSLRLVMKLATRHYATTESQLASLMYCFPVRSTVGQRG